SIHQDAIPGDRQFWITRPISWKSLLVAKVCFIVLFITLPTFVIDWVVLSALHLAPGSHLPGLLWKAGATTAGMLQVAAVAAVTRNLAQYILVSIILLYVTFALFGVVNFVDPSLFWQSLDWAQTSVITPFLLLMALSTLIWQYARRRTWASRVVLACCPG